MRISDWSSDVCSSDLGQLSRTHRLRRPSARIRSARGSPHGAPGRRAGGYEGQGGRRAGRVVPATLEHNKNILRAESSHSRGGRRCLTDRKSTRLNSVTNAQLVCLLLLEKKNNKT